MLASGDPVADSDLVEKAIILRSSALFMSRGALDPLAEKQMIFLALAGLKPVSGAGSSRWVQTHDGGMAVADDEQRVASLLRQLGLQYHIEQRSTVTLVHVARDKRALETFLEASGHRAVGLAYGYPATAVDAFVAGESMSNEQQKAAVGRLGVPVFDTFRLSQNHSSTELETMREWWLALDRYGLITRA